MEILNMLFPKILNKSKVFTFTGCVKIGLEVLASLIKKVKEVIGTEIKEDEIKLYLFADYIVVYV